MFSFVCHIAVPLRPVADPGGGGSCPTQKVIQLATISNDHSLEGWCDNCHSWPPSAMTRRRSRREAHLPTPRHSPPQVPPFEVSGSAPGYDHPLFTAGYHQLWIPPSHSWIPSSMTTPWSQMATVSNDRPNGHLLVAGCYLSPPGHQRLWSTP